MEEGGITKIDIWNEKINYIGRSHWLYQATQKESKENQTLFEKKRFEKEKVKWRNQHFERGQKVALDCTPNKVTEIYKESYTWLHYKQSNRNW